MYIRFIIVEFSGNSKYIVSILPSLFAIIFFSFFRQPSLPSPSLPLSNKNLKSSKLSEMELKILKTIKLKFLELLKVYIQPMKGNTYIYIYTYICTYTYIYIYICIYICTCKKNR
jgi:hypothetical protein